MEVSYTRDGLQIEIHAVTSNGKKYKAIQVFPYGLVTRTVATSINGKCCHIAVVFQMFGVLLENNTLVDVLYNYTEKKWSRG